MDLSRPLPDTGFQGPVKISTMAAKHGVTIAGGFSGEYCMHMEGTKGSNVQGFVTRDFNGITNHLEIIQHRTSRSPVGIFASNDKHLRILDCETNTFVGEHRLSRAVNCTATSADGRLRVIVGDSPDAWILEAETGRPIQPLRGHRDFGFACAWSPDMLHVATSNQDKTVNIWDVRTWRILQTIDSDVAGYRSLHFSPVGGGPRTLLMCEPADRIAIVNAQTFQSRQVHDFFGEIGGAGYSPDGSSIWVANSDEVFGGFIEFDRRRFGHRFGLSHPSPRQRIRFTEDRSPEWYSDLPNEWRSDAALEDDRRCVLSPTERRLRFMRGLSDEARDNLLL
jgi:WD40 repeat protein